jgi:alkaline phosphatase D
MKRRDFLKASGCFVVTASLGGITSGCGDDGGGGPDAGPVAGTYEFPQGIASGDPQSDAVMLWTRAVAIAGGMDVIPVVAQVSTTDDFAELVAEVEMTVSVDTDWTLRLLVDGLSSGTWYYYRFVSGLDMSETGRTWTAPASDADTPVSMAWVSCQDFEAGFYAAYRSMITDDEAAADSDKINVVVHMGDFIYETLSGGFQAAVDENFEPIELIDRDGNPRVVPDFPSGGGQTGETVFANTVDDYRHLYKVFLSDPDLRAARARWPFVNTWDDHEFTNDCWQSMANFDEEFTLGEPSQQRKVAANQAWFEYIPAILTGASGVTGVPAEAKDFAHADVDDEPFGEVVDDDNLATEPNNVAALDSMTIYRSLRLGQHVELVMTDTRSYRSDHAVPEELTYDSLFFFDSRLVGSYEMSIIMDQGRTANGGNPPDMLVMDNFPNTRQNSPVGTMLGADQKAWFKETMSRSDATWKIWGNEAPLLRHFIKNPGILIFDRVLNGDAWDGYNSERNELMQYLQANDVRNVVALTGDVHSHHAGYIMHDHDVQTPEPVMIELVTAGISSNSQFMFFEGPTRPPQQPALRDIVTFDDTEFGGTDKFVPNINLALLWGTESASAYSQSGDFQDAIDNREDPNPHALYADENAQGYGILRITSTEIRAELVTINRPIVDSAAGVGKKYTAEFTIPLAGQGEDPTLNGPTFDGPPPFPFNLIT